MTRFLQGAGVALSLILAGAAFAADAPAAGSPAPAFKLQDQTGKWHSVSDYQGKWGRIAKHYADVNPKGHSEVVPADLKQLMVASSKG